MVVATLIVALALLVAVVATALFTALLFIVDYQTVLDLFKDPTLLQLTDHLGLILRACAGLTFGVALLSVVGMASFFAPQAILLHKMPATAALKKSFALFTHHVGALIVYGVALMVWGLLSLIPLGLGLLIFVPVANISKYLAYREMDGSSE